jgi:1-acyl-sn-glycerol-3-phosphate acyltransferase
VAREFSTIIFSCLYWTFVATSSVLLFPVALGICLLTVPFDPNRRWLHAYTCWWAQLYLRCLPGCRVDVKGLGRIVPRTPYVLVANHQSKCDLMALSFLTVPFKWVGQKEVFRYPFIGWNAHLNGYISVDRGNTRTARRTMAACRRWLARRVPVLFFPEGGRSKTGDLRKFQSGAFRLAVEHGCDVVPIVVDGTLPIYHGAWVSLSARRIVIRVLDPISPADANASPHLLRDLTFRRMEQALIDLRGPVRDVAQRTRTRTGEEKWPTHADRGRRPRGLRA